MDKKCELRKKQEDFTICDCPRCLGDLKLAIQNINTVNLEARKFSLSKVEQAVERAWEKSS